jgi:outer membrane protein OmpU
MNIKKIGLTALAGSLVATSAYAADVSISGGASVAITKGNDKNKTTYYQNDSITFQVSGETDGGLTVTTSIELDGDSGGTTGAVDSRSIKISSAEMGTITFAGHGGDSVIGGWDDVTPSAYEEVWALTKNNLGVAATAGNIVLNGGSGDNLWRYDSPSFSGVSVHASYNSASATTGRESSYSDIGIMIAPEMVEGLSLGYATGEFDESATVVGVDASTMWAKYAYGPVTIGVQSTEYDAPTAANSDDSNAAAISYAITDSLSVSYGTHTLDIGGATADQESEGYSVSYTMGGATIAASKNKTDNMRGATAQDNDSFEINVSFAF